MKIKLFILVLLISSTVTVAQDISITFQVNMSYQIDEGNFDPENEFVDIAGTFNSWGGTVTPLSDAENDSIWEVTVDGFTAGETIEFKFRYNGAWDDREEFPGTGNNRVHEVAAEDETLYFWYNDEEPPTGPAVAGLEVSSQQVFVGGSVSFLSTSSGYVKNISWSFEGGDPVSAEDTDEVTVFYDEIGAYDVQLVVSHDFSSDTLTLVGFITVTEQDTEQLAWWNDGVFYEIFVRSFYDSDGDGIGDFQGIIEKLDYLNDGDPETDTDLGITGIWLMPIHESPSYHGYDVNDYRSINPDYGTMADFREFLDEAHDRGIKVIIDLVLNHTSTEIDWFQEATASVDADKRNWYRWSETKPSYSGPWGQEVWHNSSHGYYYGLFWGGMPDLNYEEPEVKAEMFDIAEYWLEDIGIDGFRLDAVKYIYEEGDKLEDLVATHDFWNEFNSVVKAANEQSLTVGEAWTSTEKVVPYVLNDRLDFCFDFELLDHMGQTFNNESAGPLSFHVNKMLNSYPYYQFGTFLTNHDQNRIMDLTDENPEIMKLVSSVYLTLPGIPFIYYGEEVGMTGVKPDENIRRPMSWSGGANAGFSTVTPWNGPAGNYQTFNVEDEDRDEGSLLNWYRNLVNLRTSEPALGRGNYREIDLENGQLYAYMREDGDDQFLMVINTGESEINFTLNNTILETAEDEDFFIDLLHDEGYEIVAGAVDFEIPGYTSMLLKAGTVIPTGAQYQITTNVSIYPNPSQGFFQLKVNQSEYKQYSILDGMGRAIRTGEIYSGLAKIDLKAVSRGVYIVQVSSGESTISKRLVLK